MSDPPTGEHPGFPADETVFVITVPLHLNEPGAMRSTYVTAAATNRKAAEQSAYAQWRKLFPQYLAGQPSEWKVRQKLPLKSALFWSGFVSGMVSLPLLFLGIAILVAAFK